MIESLIKYIRLFGPLGALERRFLASEYASARLFSPHEDIVKRSASPSAAHVLLSGFACRCTLLPNGRRQIIGLLLPGDLIGFEAITGSRCVHGVVAVTRVESAQIPAALLASWMERASVLRQAFWQMHQLQSAIAREWIINIGTRPAPERIVHFFCEMLARTKAIGLSNGFHCPIPLTQIELADVTAMTPVHVNRVLARLRQEDVVAFRAGKLEVLNRPALERLAQFDPSYLTPLAPSAPWSPADLGADRPAVRDDRLVQSAAAMGGSSVVMGGS